MLLFSCSDEVINGLDTSWFNINGSTFGPIHVLNGLETKPTIHGQVKVISTHGLETKPTIRGQVKVISTQEDIQDRHS